MGSGPSKESVWQYFVNKSANNLHIVLGMSPVGDTLRTRCRNFPGETQCQVLLDFNLISDFIFITVCSFFLRTDEQHCDRLVLAVASTGATCGGSVFPGYVISYAFLMEKFVFRLPGLYLLYLAVMRPTGGILSLNLDNLLRIPKILFFLQVKVQ